jgi:hypothetical protein
LLGESAFESPKGLSGLEKWLEADRPKGITDKDVNVDEYLGSMW